MGESDDKARIQRLERELLLIRAAFDNAGDAIKIGDLNGRSLYHNRVFQDMFGYTVDQLVQAGGSAVLFADPRIADEVLTCVAAGGSWNGEAVIRTRGGRLVTTALRADQIRDEHSNALGLIGFFTDLTRGSSRADPCNEIENGGLVIGSQLEGNLPEFDRFQHQSPQFKGFALLGHIIAGAAHELREPLNNIIGYAEWLQEHERDEHARSKLDVIMAEGGRAAGIVSDLLAFARRERLYREQVDINETINRVLAARADDLSAAGVRVMREMSPLPNVFAEGRLLERVLANIVANAEQAMAPQGEGSLTVRTRLKRESGCVVVEIADTGPGIAMEHLPRVFDPFFTTKRKAQGLGLGLSFSYGVVAMHGGKIKVESEFGAGACFTVEIPVAAVDPA